MLNELNPQPLPPIERNRIRIYVTPDVTYDLKKMQKVTATILGRLGCGGCHSGRILEFLDIQEFVINPKSLEPQEIPGGFRF